MFIDPDDPDVRPEEDVVETTEGIASPEKQATHEIAYDRPGHRGHRMMKVKGMDPSLADDQAVDATVRDMRASRSGGRLDG